MKTSKPNRGGQIPINTETDGTCRTIKANYWKVSRANFLHTNDWGATGVIEIHDEEMDM